VPCRSCVNAAIMQEASTGPLRPLRVSKGKLSTRLGGLNRKRTGVNSHNLLRGSRTDTPMLLYSEHAASDYLHIMDITKSNIQAGLL
jgi:hypothetical protein